MSRINLSYDLGESLGAYTTGRDEEVIMYISSANTGCGFHAGSPCVMDHTVRLAKEKGVSIGTHPGSPGLMGSGRRNTNITPAEAEAYMKYQIGALNTFYASGGVPPAHVKPHGALHNVVAKDMKLAMAPAKAIHEVDPKLVFLDFSGSKMSEAAQQAGLTCASEIFTDRVYNVDGSLVARGTPGTVIRDVDECVRHITDMARGNVVTVVTGEQIPLKPQSICVHGDNAKVVESIKHIHENPTREGVEIVDLRTHIE